jgi:hypothetical protein
MFEIKDIHELGIYSQVFGASVIELWLGIPLGLLMKLYSLLVALTAALGSIFTMIIVVLVGENLRSRFITMAL